MVPEFVHRGQALVDQGKYQEAVKVCRLGLLAHPTAIGGRLVLGRALLALTRHDEVLAEMRVALEIEASNADALALKGEALFRKGDVYQAAEIVGRARESDPSSAEIQSLFDEVSAAATGSPGNDEETVVGGAFPPAESRTKHYPTHRGTAVTKAGSGNVTQPTAALRGPRHASRTTPPPSELAVGDGTIELDPELEGVEMVDDDLVDPPIDPPLPAGHQPARSESTMPVELGDPDVMEVDADELLEDSASGEIPGEVGAALAQDAYEEDTVHYGPPPSGKRRAPAPGDFGATGSEAGTRPERPGMRGGGAPDIDELFPEDESGVSSVELTSEREPRGRVERAKPGKRTRSRSEDMRVIRAGLSLEDTGQRRRPAKAERTAAVPRRSKAARVQAGKPRGEPTATAAPGRRKRRRRRRPVTSRAVIGVYALFAILVLGGGVYAGFEIRKIRLDREIVATERRAAERAARDTYRGYVDARKSYADIVGVRDNAETRAAVARMSAAIAAEYGEGLAEAVSEVDGLDGGGGLDGALARAYLAIARGRADDAEAAAREAVESYPDEPMAHYVKGRAALLAGDADAAVDAFKEARKLSNERPAIFVALGRADAAAGRYAEAKVRFERALEITEGHPAATLWRARILARADALPDPGDPEEALTAIIAEGQEPLANQKVGVSPSEVGWAALALAEVHIARGNTDAARDAILIATEHRPGSDLAFSESLTEVLLAVGDTKAAAAEAARASETWPDRVASRVVLAEVALDRGDAEEALEVLAAGDVTAEPGALAVRGRARLALGQLDEAESDLDAALAADPDDLDAQVARAELDLRRDNPRSAVGRLELLYPGNEGDRRLSLAYAAALRRTDNPKEARRILEELIEKAPTGDAYLELARLERDTANFRAARSAFGKAIELAPDAPTPRLEAALLALDTGDLEGATEATLALLEEDPENPQLLLEAARVLSLGGKIERARELLDKAEDDAEERWKLARERGRTAILDGSPTSAIGFLERAASLEPDDGETRLLLIDAFLLAAERGATDNGEKARRSLEDVLKRFAGRPESQLALGRVDQFFDRLDTARIAFAKAKKMLDAQKAPPRARADVHYWIGRVAYFAGKLQTARRELSKAVDLDPGHYMAHRFLGFLYAEKRQNRKAAQHLKASVNLQPKAMPTSWFYLGEAQIKSRQRRAGRKSLQKYLELAPRGDLAPDARKLLR